MRENVICGCGSCTKEYQHTSDCAVHNMPAFPKGECDCITRYQYLIKEQCEIEFALIKNATARLRILQNDCRHINTFFGNYTYRVGSIIPAIICSDCGTLIGLDIYETKNLIK